MIYIYYKSIDTGMKSQAENNVHLIIKGTEKRKSIAKYLIKTHNISFFVEAQYLFQNMFITA